MPIAGTSTVQDDCVARVACPQTSDMLVRRTLASVPTRGLTAYSAPANKQTNCTGTATIKVRLWSTDIRFINIRGTAIGGTAIEGTAIKGTTISNTHY